MWYRRALTFTGVIDHSQEWIVQSSFLMKSYINSGTYCRLLRHAIFACVGDWDVLVYHD